VRPSSDPDVQVPRLLLSGLTNRAYIVTRYTEVDGDFIAHEKFDVTDDVLRAAVEITQIEASREPD
jgi:hypothetical protein